MQMRSAIDRRATAPIACAARMAEAAARRGPPVAIAASGARRVFEMQRGLRGFERQGEVAHGGAWLARLLHAREGAHRADFIPPFRKLST
jgi:hypothetical protein